MYQKKSAVKQKNEAPKIAANKELLHKYFDAAFINFDAEATRPLITEEYIQHNPLIPSGAEPFLNLLGMLKEGGMEFINQRVIADEEFVVSHNLVNNVPIPGYGNVVTFDVWRVVDGKLGEHWDNVTARIDSPDTSSHLQIDGSKLIEDWDKTGTNKNLVIEFVSKILIEKNYSKLADFISIETFHQHNPNIVDGIVGLEKAKMLTTSKGIEINYNKIHFTVGEGNFVFSASEGLCGNQKTAFFDLFRVAEDKIVEHWNVMEEIPAEMAHGNGKF